MKIQTGRGIIPLITLIAIWSISALTSLPGLAVSPILGDLTKIFPKATDLDIQMLTSLPSLLIIPFILLGGKLTEKVDYVRVLKVGLWLFAASGILYLISNRMWQLIVVSALLGIGSGLIIPLSTGLVSRYFVGTYRVKQFGLSNCRNGLSCRSQLASAFPGLSPPIDFHSAGRTFKRRPDGRSRFYTFFFCRYYKRQRILRTIYFHRYRRQQVRYSHQTSDRVDALLWRDNIYRGSGDLQSTFLNGKASLFQWQFRIDDFAFLSGHHRSGFLPGQDCSPAERTYKSIQPPVYGIGIVVNLDSSDRMADYSRMYPGWFGIWHYSTYAL